MLAENWDVNSDYTQFKLSLRKGIQFHTGRELTSDDVKYTLLRVRDPKVTTGALAAVSNWFSAIDTPDKYTVTLKADASRPAFFDGLEILNIVDKVTAEGPDGTSKIVGTGPFAFVEWAQGDHFTLTKNTNYWQTGRPYLDGVVTSVRNQSAMALQLVGGNLDSLRTPAIDDYVKLRADPNYVGLAHPNPGTILEIGMNAKRTPLDDKRVRQAMNYAMNRERFAETAFKGVAQPLSLPWMPGAPAFDQARSNFFSYDLDKARALLKDAGVTNLEMNAVISTAQPALNLYMQILQTDLASIGVTVSVKSVEQAVWSDLLVNKKPEHDGFWGGNDSLTNVHPAGIFTSPGWRTVNNHSNFESDAWNQIVTTVSTETDPTKQKAAFAAMNDFLLDQAFTTAMSTNPITILTSNKVHDIGYLMHLGGISFTDTWLEA
ncbi:MAG: ABC transporter substrate-binding protein [Chloroflexi bacterium]|nr:ABC transporter substrate-binding protein [Chloroflexota bacterium]MBV9600264.1 ABC transporter substrate-binding protein [Chloroflexota bacterium]